jgi:anthranilate synthase component 1
VIRYASFGDEALGTLPAPTDAQIQQRYQRDRADYAAVERRKFTQLVVPTQAAAQAIVAEVRGGKSLDVAAREKGLATAAIGPSTQAELTTSASAAVAQAAFGAQSGALAAPARGALGWYVLRVDAIDKRPARTLDQARGEIVTALATEQRRAALDDLTAQLEDRFDKGESLVDVARELKLELTSTAPATADGRIYGTHAGEAVPQVLGRVVQTAFDMEEESPQVAEVVPGQTYVIFDVPSITPSATAPLAEIRNDVITMWRRDEGSKGAKAAAERIEARVKQGATLAAAVSAETRSLPTPQPIDLTREQLARQGRVPPSLALFFSMAAGTVKKLEAGGDAGWYVVQLRQIEAGQIAANDPLVFATLQQLGRVSATNTSSSSPRRCSATSESSATSLRSGRSKGSSAATRPNRTPAVPGPLPDNAAAACSALAAGRPALVWRKLVADTETPVGAALKLIEPGRGDFLLESVEGGAVRGRYSLLGLDPDLMFRATGHSCEVNRAWRHDREAFEPLPGDALAELRALADSCRIDVPRALPPALACLVGYFGYETIGLVENLPRARGESDLALPDMLFARPTLILVFDGLTDELFCIAPLWAGAGDPARAVELAGERIDEALRKLERAAPPPLRDTELPEMALAPVMPAAEYERIVLEAKDYITAGDIFQVVLAQRFTCPFPLPPFALYRALRRVNPSPFLYFLDLPGFAVVGSSPEILVRVRDGEVTIRPIAGTRPRGKTEEEDREAERSLLADPKECAEHLMLLDLGRHDVGRVASAGQRRGHRELHDRALTAT